MAEVERAFDAIGALAGAGSQAARRAALHDLLARADAGEQAFLVRLLLGDLRQGALAGVMADAIARAAGVPPSAPRSTARRWTAPPAPSWSSARRVSARGGRRVPDARRRRRRRPRDDGALSEDAGTTPGIGAAGERFGSAVAIGEHDVVIGVPNEDVSGAVDAGVVYLLPAADPTGSGGRVVNQSKAYVPDTAESGDHFGAAVAAGRLSTWWEDEGDVLIGAPDDDGTGSATVLHDDARKPRPEAIRSTLAVAGGRFGTALDIA